MVGKVGGRVGGSVKWLWHEHVWSEVLDVDGGLCSELLVVEGEEYPELSEHL